MSPTLRNWHSMLATHWIWLLPALLLLIMSPLSLSNLDSTRDFIMAHRIISGQELPLLGPQLAFSFHIGPWWFYLMALPLVLTKTWLGLAVTVALLNGMKFYLAFRVGCLILNKQLGGLLVLAMLMVSLTYLQTVTFTHTSLVETCMLLMLFFTLKTELKKPRHWLLLGLLTALAFHSHPTAILIGYFALLKWLPQGQKAYKVAAFLFGLVLLFAPMLYQELTTASQVSNGMLSYFDQQTVAFDVTGLFALWYGLLISAPLGILSINLPSFVAITLLVIQLLIQLVALVMPWWQWKNANQQIKWLYLHSWVFFILSSVGLLLIRERTPWYMTYGLSLSFALLVAAGLYMTFNATPTRKPRTVLFAWVTGVFVATNINFLPSLYRGDIQVPATIMYDLKTNDPELSAASFEFPAWLAKDHGQLTCDMRPVALHGPYATLIYTHSGMEHLSVCQTGLSYGPDESSQHLLGIPKHFTPWVDKPPLKQVGSIHFYHPIDISKQQNSWAENFAHDYDRQINGVKNWQQTTTQAQVQGGTQLLVTKLLGFKMQQNIQAVKANGQTLEPVASNYYSQLYKCTACDGQTTQWQISYQESVRGMTNIVSF